MVDIKALNYQPDLLAIHAKNPQRYPYFLSSAQCGGEQGRYSILFAFPQQKIECLAKDPDIFIEFIGQYECSNSQKNSADLPFVGGWFFYFSYEYAQYIETHLKLSQSDLPIAFAHRIPAGFIIDHQNNASYIFCEDKYNEYLPQLVTDSTQQALPSFNHSLSLKIDEEDATEYLSSVSKAKKYIIDGDIFQANLSRLWHVELKNSVTAIECFQQLLIHNPSPFSALVTLNDEASIVSSSPERLVKIKDGKAITRPIAGTHPRGENDDDDLALSEKLLKHPKEQAEHIMLIDLERNDLGRFCQPGSIKVDEFMVLESYQHVHHIVSNVVGEMQQGTTLKDVIHAVFPGGTITGCPKVRCMEIIAELEQRPRDCYTGSVGYLNHNGDGDFNILIRTMLYQNKSISFRAGAGIVADSNPLKELEETRHKAKGLIYAIS